MSCEKSGSLACHHVTGRDCPPGSAFIWAWPLSREGPPVKRTGTLATVQCRAFTVSIQFCTRSPLPYYLILCRTILSIRCSKYCTRTHSKTQLLVTSQNKGTNRLQPIFIQLKLKAPESVACTQTIPARRSLGHAVVMFALIHRFVLLSTYCGRTLQGNSYNLEGAYVVWKAVVLLSARTVVMS